MIKKIFIIAVLNVFLINCSSNKVSESEVNKNSTPESLYLKAMDFVKNDNYDKAVSIFSDIEKKYPLSNEAVQSQIMSGFIDYMNLEYESAIFKFNKIIQKYPSHKNIDYVYYMKAICYFEQISHEELDSNNNLQALNNFNQVLTRFPNSLYSFTL